jgi:hypothetical protein
VGPLPGGAGEEVEHPAAGLAPIVDDRGPVAAAVDIVPVAAAAAAGAGQSVGMEQVQEPLVAGPLVHQVEDREVHGAASVGLSPGEHSRRWRKRAHHQTGHMSQCGFPAGAQLRRLDSKGVRE